MAEEGSEGSVANSSTTSNIWELHGNSLASWNSHNDIPSWHPSNPNSNSSCEDDISGLSTDDSPHQFMEPCASRGEPANDSHLWSKVLLSIGSGGGLSNNQDVGENFLEALSSKNISPDMFEPVCDYLKKMDSSWDYANSASYNNIERQLNSFSGTDWSIAPPCPEVDRQIAQYSESDLSQMKHNLSSNSPMYEVADNSSFLPSYVHDMKVENLHQQMEGSDDLLHRSFKSDGTNRYQIGENEKYFYGMAEAPWMNTRNISDVISFNGCLNKAIVDPQSSKPCLKATYQQDNKKPSNMSSAPARSKSTSEGKKKRSDESSETQFKKPKHETSTVTSAKVQVPKVKLTERITALQQIVSPFGKTDTASVLQEAIGYIKFLQEQVQLLSNPYMKSNVNKDPWGMLERKDKGEAKFDLRSRGLCLVPISCTPQVYRENTGSDYWTPTYRGCLYR